MGPPTLERRLWKSDVSKRSGTAPRPARLSSRRLVVGSRASSEVSLADPRSWCPHSFDRRPWSYALFGRRQTACARRSYASLCRGARWTGCRTHVRTGRRRSRWCTPTAWYTTICRAWTTTTCGVDGRPVTRSTAMPWPHSSAMPCRPSAFEWILAEEQPQAPAPIWWRCLARAAGAAGMVGGQVLDLSGSSGSRGR